MENAPVRMRVSENEEMAYAGAGILCLAINFNSGCAQMKFEQAVRFW